MYEVTSVCSDSKKTCVASFVITVRRAVNASCMILTDICSFYTLPNGQTVASSGSNVMYDVKLSESQLKGVLVEIVVITILMGRCIFDASSKIEEQNICTVGRKREYKQENRIKE